ncbi:MAG: hypothetical protein AABW49_03000 [Nanoarchaeota archaeon]
MVKKRIGKKGEKKIANGVKEVNWNTVQKKGDEPTVQVPTIKQKIEIKLGKEKSSIGKWVIFLALVTILVAFFAFTTPGQAFWDIITVQGQDVISGAKQILQEFKKLFDPISLRQEFRNPDAKVIDPTKSAGIFIKEFYTKKTDYYTGEDVILIGRIELKNIKEEINLQISCEMDHPLNNPQQALSTTSLVEDGGKKRLVAPIVLPPIKGSLRIPTLGDDEYNELVNLVVSTKEGASSFQVFCKIPSNSLSMLPLDEPDDYVTTKAKLKVSFDATTRSVIKVFSREEPLTSDEYDLFIENRIREGINVKKEFQRIGSESFGGPLVAEIIIESPQPLTTENVPQLPSNIPVVFRLVDKVYTDNGHLVRLDDVDVERLPSRFRVDPKFCELNDDELLRINTCLSSLKCEDDASLYCEFEFNEFNNELSAELLSAKFEYVYSSEKDAFVALLKRDIAIKP